jgi:hypothetical protein
MGTRRNRTHWLLGVLVVAMGTGVLSACEPPKDATIEATEIRVSDDGSTEEAFAVCPGDKRAVGGGIVQSGAPDEHFVQASGPLDATGTTAETKDGDVAKQWYASVLNDEGFGFADFRVFAICSATSDATVEATNLSVASGRSGEAFAVCPGGKRAVGGGVVQSGPAFRLRVRVSGPLDAAGTTAGTKDGDVAKQWYAAVRNTSSSGVNVKVFAMCSAATSATIEAEDFVVGTGADGESSAVCPGGKRALGGGVVQSGPADGLHTSASGPLDSTGTTTETNDGDIAKQWYSAVRNDSGSSVNLKAFAICE